MAYDVASRTNGDIFIVYIQVIEAKLQILIGVYLGKLLISKILNINIFMLS